MVWVRWIICSFDACKLPDKKQPEATAGTPAAANSAAGPDRQPQEEEHYKNVTSYTFFTANELATITILGDIIIPKDDVSGSASDAKVTDFIEFIVKDMPSYQVPVRRWSEVTRQGVVQLVPESL